MPEMSFRIRWPDGSQATYYSPSLIVRDYFAEGEILRLPDFLQRTRDAMQIASDRVAQKYGFACSRAHATLAAIDEKVAAFSAQPDAKVTILEFSP